MNKQEDQAANSVVTTHLLGGRVTLRQASKGYRVGMDGALLAAVAAEICRKGRGRYVIELGCGVGGAMLSLKARCLEAHIIGLERDSVASELARTNIGLNGFCDVEAKDFDIAHGFVKSGLKRADMVISNPPYFDDEGAMRPVSPEKRGAWMADDGLGVWLEFAMAAVRDGGDIIFIHRADRLADLLTGLSAKCGSFQILPIQPFVDKPAKRVIVMAKRLGKAPLKLLPPLVLHDDGERKHRPEIEAVLRGEALRLG